MSGWTEGPGETHPLRGPEARREAASRNDKDQEDGGAVSSAVGSPPPPGFIFPRDIADNPYATQRPYNASYKSMEGSVAEQARRVSEEGNVSGGEEDAKGTETATSSATDHCIPYCIIAIIVAAFIAAIGSVIYLSIKNPKVAKLLYNVTNEVINSPRDDSFKKYFNPTIVKEVAKFVNETAG